MQFRVCGMHNHDCVRWYWCNLRAPNSSLLPSPAWDWKRQFLHPTDSPNAKRITEKKLTCTTREHQDVSGCLYLCPALLTRAAEPELQHLCVSVKLNKVSRGWAIHLGKSQSRGLGAQQMHTLMCCDAPRAQPHLGRLHCQLLSASQSIRAAAQLCGLQNGS